jgi:1-deoxy-D-xylulose-5-phosphate synthase
MPNIEIVQPSNAVEAHQLLDYALEFSKKSVAIRYSKNSTEIFDNSTYTKILKPTWIEYFNQGNANLICYGDNFTRLNQYIKQHKLPINIINALFIKPMDYDMLDKIILSGLKTYVLEDVTKISGLGSSILEYLASKQVQLPIRIFGLPDEFIEQGTQTEIYKLYHLDEESIINEILKTVED